jgi:large subunit ribosomal protein L23
MGILIKPILTEKQTEISEKFPNRYAFRVVPTANKVEIKNAVEKIYNVKVDKVNTMNYLGKTKVRGTKSGYVKGRTASYKKAIVTLKEGHQIDFFSNI